MTVIIMIGFARSGGTVLNQCLGCLPNVVILSEVNPLGGGSGKTPVSYQTVKEQAKNWYQIELESDDFIENILELEKICANKGQYLIVRDWTFVNFTSLINNNWNPPNMLLTIETLERKCDLIPFAFVRDSIDVWISRGTPNAKDFFDSYIRYIQAIAGKNIPVFKYEDFCINPDKVIREVCEITGLKYSNSYEQYTKYDRVNGDIQILSRGREQGAIKLLPRKLIAKEKIIELNQCTQMIKANSLLGYPTSYYDVPREKIWIKGAKATFKTISKLWT